jgi:hypothetical protein
MELNEFMVGKAEAVSDKIFRILSRKTGTKFTVKKSISKCRLTAYFHLKVME